MAQQLTRTVGVINLSQFLRAALTILSRRITFHSSAKSVTSALDKSCNRDKFVCRRDLQKLRHGGLPAGTIFWLKYRDSYRRTAPPTFTPSTAGPLAFIGSKKYHRDNSVMNQRFISNDKTRQFLIYQRQINQDPTNANLKAQSNVLSQFLLITWRVIS
jgi:hypothetical protein